MEQWSKIKGYEGYKGAENWEVSDAGNVRKFGEPYRPSIDSQGYAYFNLAPSGELVRVHRLVLLAFTGPPPKGWIATHLDRNRANNCLSNLAWVQRRDITLAKRKKKKASKHAHFEAWLAKKVKS